MKPVRLIAGALAALLVSTAASAQVYTIGSNPQGSMFFTLAAAISKVATQGSKQFRVAPYGGSSTYVPLLDRNEIEYGMINGGEIAYAYEGVQLYDGKPSKNLRLVAAIIPQLTGYAVRTDSPIRTIADFKGKRLATEYTAGRVIERLAAAILNTADLTWKDVKPVPTSNFIDAIDLFIENKIDVAYITLNIGAAQKAMASIKGGWRYVSIPNTPEAAQKIAAVFPSARIGAVRPARENIGVVDDPTYLEVIDFFLVTNAAVPEADIYEMTKTIHAGGPELVKVHQAFNDFAPGNMHPKHPVPYHPGAEKFYREKGM